MMAPRTSGEKTAIGNEPSTPSKAPCARYGQRSAEMPITKPTKVRFRIVPAISAGV